MSNAIDTAELCIQLGSDLRAGSGIRIAPLDPLEADPWLARLPDWNQAGDTNAIVAALVAIGPSEAQVRGFSADEAAAALRDVGMLLSSLKRHGVEPVEAVPSIQPVLLALGEKCGTVPRDTVYHYGPWNPQGPRQRRFTADANEDGLIHCVRSAAPGVEKAIEALVNASSDEPGTPAFAECCQLAARSTMAMVRSIDFARQRVDVAFFARVLRPYFEAITVDGVSHMGPAAAHLPLSLVNHLVWGSDCEDMTYRLFQEDAVRYTVPCWRELYWDTAVGPSLVTRVVEAIDASSGYDRPLLEGAVALYTLFRVLLAFRGRHKVMADRAYDPKVRLYAVGSGGFSTTVVHRLLELTRERAATLKQSFRRRLKVSLRPRMSVVAELSPRGRGAA